MDTLTLILTTLNRLEVRGRENLSRLLGCIQAIEKLKEEASHDRDDVQRPDDGD